MTTGHGETAKRQVIIQILYMDDLKLYGRNSDQLDGLLHTLRTFCDDIQMKIGLDQICCYTLCQQQAIWAQLWSDGTKNGQYHCLEPGQVYKYLGLDDCNDIKHSMMRERLRRAYFRRVKVVLRTELYGRNKILAINGFALPVPTYSLSVIPWGCTDL